LSKSDEDHYEDPSSNTINDTDRHDYSELQNVGHAYYNTVAPSHGLYADLSRLVEAVLINLYTALVQSSCCPV